jgi:hypothetical protein
MRFPETETTAGAAPAPDVLVDWPPNAIGSPRANKSRIDKAHAGRESMREPKAVPQESSTYRAGAATGSGVGQKI